MVLAGFKIRVAYTFFEELRQERNLIEEGSLVDECRFVVCSISSTVYTT